MGIKEQFTGLDTNNPLGGIKNPFDELADGFGFFLKSCHGKYLSARPNGSAEWNRDAAGEWERILAEALGNGKTALKSVHGRYLSAQPDGSVRWDSEDALQWEIWTVEQSGNSISLKSAHGKYLSVHPDGTVRADADTANGWETFTIEVHK